MAKRYKNQKGKKKMDNSSHEPVSQQKGETPAITQGKPEENTEKTNINVEQASMSEKIAQLERLVRSVGRDSLTLLRAQQESQAALQTITQQTGSIDIDIKGMSQTVWRAMQENQHALQGAEEHFAGALRDLEKRISDEMQIQAQRSAMRALLPALDDLDLILSQQLRKPGTLEDPFVNGVRLVRSKLVQGLREQGFEEIQVEPGKTVYDPKIHDAVEADVPESFYDKAGVTPQTILFVRRAGFTYMGQVFRSPQVFIKKA